MEKISISRSFALLSGSSVAMIVGSVIAAKAFAMLVGASGLGVFNVLQGVLALATIIGAMGVGAAVTQMGAAALSREDAIGATSVRRAAWLVALSFTKLDKQRNSAQMLVKTTLEKALFSSPAACLQTTETRIQTLKKHAEHAAFANDLAQLESFAESLKRVQPKDFSKYQRLLTVLKDDPSYEVLAENDMGDAIVATPAIADGRIFTRTRTRLICNAAGTAAP
jgi:hypothetical protein